MLAKTLLIASITYAACTAANADGLNIRGARSCGEWVEGHQVNVSTLDGTFAETWLIGYLSGIAAATGKDFLGGTDNASIFLWVTNYCRANPLNSLDEGGTSLFALLTKRKGT
jgi:hypothetical protein